MAGVLPEPNDEALLYLNRQLFPKVRKFECQIHSYNEKENEVKVWAWYRDSLLRKRCLNLDLLGEGYFFRDRMHGTKRDVDEEIDFCVDASEAASNEAKLKEKGVWSKYGSSFY